MVTWKKILPVAGFFCRLLFPQDMDTRCLARYNRLSFFAYSFLFGLRMQPHSMVYEPFLRLGIMVFLIVGMAMIPFWLESRG
jgi:hypothetical protein